jgi:Concanavalin A-like lectin/glucanases superfamily
MSTSYNPQIVTDGLITYLDAGNSRSYPATGTTCNDLSGQGNTGTLINGTTFNTGSLGHFIFDGIDDHINILNNTTVSFTIGCWIKTTANSNGGSQGYEGNAIAFSDVGGTNNAFILAVLNNRASWFTGNPEVSVNGTTVLNTGQWFYLVGTKNAATLTKELFVNAVSEGTGATNASLLNVNPLIQIANGQAGRYFNGSVSSFQIYNRVLSNNEIKQNFNALRGRYGI